MALPRNVEILLADVRESSFYDGNSVTALDGVETWLQMKALDIWRARGGEGAEPSIGGRDPCQINGHRGIRIWGVFPDDEIAKATFEAAIAKGVLLRTGGAGHYALEASGVAPLDQEATGIDLSRLNPAVRSALINRGHSEEEILRMSPREAFVEYCEWHGLIRWGDSLWENAKHLMTMEPQQEEPEPQALKRTLPFGIEVETDGLGGGKIVSNLSSEFGFTGDEQGATAVANSLESFVLALACEGVDVGARPVRKALETAVENIAERIEWHYEDKLGDTPRLPSQGIAWNPDAFAGYGPEQLELIRKGFSSALDRAYEAEKKSHAAKIATAPTASPDETIYFSHPGDGSVGISGDRAELRIDLSGFDAEDAADARKWVREGVEKVLGDAWGGVKVMSVTEEELLAADEAEAQMLNQESGKMKAGEVISGIVHRHKVDMRYVGRGPSYEATAVASDALVEDLRREKIPFEIFTANNKEHPDFGKRCVSFQFFGDVEVPAGYYYGTIKAPEGEKGLLESLGVSLGNYDEKTGAFYAEVGQAAFDRLKEFPADFAPKLHFRSDALLASDKGQEEYSQDELLAEKAFCEWWLNGPRRAEREVTKPEKITDVEVILYQVNQELKRFSAPAADAEVWGSGSEATPG